jgi:hypothetical protein
MQVRGCLALAPVRFFDHVCDSGTTTLPPLSVYPIAWLFIRSLHSPFALILLFTSCGLDVLQTLMAEIGVV